MELKTKTIEIEKEKYKIQEISADVMFDLMPLVRKDEAAYNKKLLEKSVIEPIVDLKKMPARIGNKLLLEILKINGVTEDFRKVPGVLPKVKSGK